MHTVGGAFAWEFWRRYRYLTAFALAYSVVLVVVIQIMAVAGTLDPRDVVGWLVPVWGIFMFAVPTFGQTENSDIFARESPYPRRLFAMPVRTTALVGWPMAICGATAALVWVLTGALVLRPVGGMVPLYWPAVFMAALVAWGQALLWCPYPLISLRVFIALPVLGVLITGAALGYALQVPPFVLLAVSAALVPAAYVVAVIGVARARRGDVPVWHWPFLRERVGSAAPRRSFASPADALYWINWRRAGGYTLPILMVIMLVPELTLIWVFGAGKLPDMIAAMFLGTIVTILPVMAAAAGGSLGNTRPWAPGGYAMPAFIAARPTVAAEMITVKLRVGVRVLLLTWAAILVVNLLAVPFTEIAAPLSAWARQLIGMEGIHGGLLLLFAIPVLVVLSLKTMVDHLWIGLAGRTWLFIAYCAAVMAALIALGILIQWINVHHELHPWLLTTVPWLAGLALALKLGAGLLMGRVLLRRGLAAPRTLMRFALAFVAGAAVLVVLAFWLTPPEYCHPLVAGAVAVVVLLPMVRLGLAPLALDWNRHR